ncbi:MAG: hypothetical protein ACR2FE_03660 [Aeromicrobium sp.]
MTSLTVQDRRGNRWLVITPSRLAVVALTSGSVAVALGCLLATGHRGPAWPALVIAYLALIALALPDGLAGLATLATYGTWWLFAVRDVTTPWVLPAAIALLVFHVGVAHLASVPAGISTGRDTVWTWCRDGFLVAGFTALVAGVARYAHDLVSTGPTIVGLTLLLVVLVPLIARRIGRDTSDGLRP